MLCADYRTAMADPKHCLRIGRIQQLPSRAWRLLDPEYLEKGEKVANLDLRSKEKLALRKLGLAIGIVIVAIAAILLLSF